MAAKYEQMGNTVAVMLHLALDLCAFAFFVHFYNNIKNANIIAVI